jgi:hypothetical protein
VPEGSVIAFAKFLNDLEQATNESQKRHLFTVLAAVGFDGTDFATELSLGAEYRVRFEKAGLIRRGAIDSFYGSLVVEFENDLSKTHDHALEQLRGYSPARGWRTGTRIGLISRSRRTAGPGRFLSRR